MIIRILHDRQYDVPESDKRTIDELDAELIDAVDDGDETRFRNLVETLADTVRLRGTPLGPEQFVPSQLIVPGPDCTLKELEQLLEGSPLP